MAGNSIAFAMELGEVAFKSGIVRFDGDHAEEKIVVDSCGSFAFDDGCECVVHAADFGIQSVFS